MEKVCQVAKAGTQLKLNVHGTDTDMLEIRIISDRNRAISRYSDVSPYAPPQWPKPKNEGMSDIWYPVVDIELEPGMDAVATFSAGSGGRWVVNGMTHTEERSLDEVNIIPGDRMDEWENSIFVKDSSRTLEQFYLRFRVPIARQTEYRHTFRLLSAMWNGTVIVLAADESGTRELGRVRVETDAIPVVPSVGGDGLTLERLQHALAATISFLQRARVQNPHSPFSGGLHQFYDLDAGTYRSSHWMWGWGPVVKLLLDAADSTELSPLLDRPGLRQYARSIGETILSFQVRDPLHPAYGVVLNRWDPGLKYPGGYRPCACIADALFCVGWAWLPLYEATNDPRYLEASLILTDLVERLLPRFELLPQQFLPNDGIWSDHTIDEHGFGTEGLSELYRITRNERHRTITTAYMDQCLARFQREDGLWDRRWVRSSRTLTPTEYMTRGLGWAMEGLLACQRAVPDGPYLELAVKMANRVIEAQQSAGFWTFRFDKPVEEVGISEKGTALWSFLLYRLYRVTGDAMHLQAARKALVWCLDNQYAGPDVQANGALIGCSPHSAVAYRRWFRVACAYASAFFGLSVLEEIHLRKER